MNRIRVLVVDDSAIVRDVLTENLSQYDDIEIIGTAPDPYIARDKIVKLDPDVITLDIEMPKMNGLNFLEKLMIYHPMPVIIVSSVTTNDIQASMKAIDIGAFDVVNKPGGSISVTEVVDDVYYKIKEAYKVKDTFVSRRKLVDERIKSKKITYNKNILSEVSTTDKLIAIGASTGGPVSLEFVLKNLPPNVPPILIVQHMPLFYTAQFALRLNDICEVNVKEAEEGDIVTNGTVYIARGGNHLELVRRGATLYTRLTDGPKVHFQRPAVDVLFQSVAQLVGKNALGIILTGMGKDGADGLLEMKNKGAQTIAQDEASCVVFGMPYEAIELGAAQKICPLEDIPDKIVQFSKQV